MLPGAGAAPPSPLFDYSNAGRAMNAEPFPTLQESLQHDISRQRPQQDDSFSLPPSPQDVPPRLLSPPPSPPPQRSLANAASPSVTEIPNETSRIEQVQNTLKFIHALESNPRLADDNLDAETLRHLSDPPKAPPILTPDETLSVKLFLADTDGSDKIYNDARSAIIERHPGDDVLSLYQVRSGANTKELLLIFKEDNR